MWDDINTMKSISQGKIEVDIKKYVDMRVYDYNQLYVITFGLNIGIDDDRIFNPDIDDDEMLMIVYDVADGCDVESAIRNIGELNDIW